MISFRLISIFFLILFLQSCETESISESSKNLENTNNTKVSIASSTESKGTSNVKTNSTSTSNKNINIDPSQIDMILLEELVHEEVNKVRISNNLQQLKKHATLKKAAEDQNNYAVRLGKLTHQQINKGKEQLNQRIQFYGGGFQNMAENLLYEGFIVRTTNGSRKEIIAPTYEKMAHKMVESWLNSPGHRINIMNPIYDQVGTAIGYNSDLSAVFSAQVFGKTF